MPNHVVPVAEENNINEEIHNEDDDPVANYVDQRIENYLKVSLLAGNNSDNYKAKAPPLKNLVEEEHKENS